MNKALIVIYVWFFISLLSYAHMHGQERTYSKYNFWDRVLTVIISLTFLWWALGWKFI